MEIYFQFLLLKEVRVLAGWISPFLIKYLPKLSSETRDNSNSPEGPILLLGYQTKQIF